MSKIEEIVVEPSKIFVGSTFKLKIKVVDDLENKKYVTSETGLHLKTEDGKKLITEWTRR